MRVYFTTQDNGDGSSSVVFFDSQECIDFLEENDPDTYASGEGGSSFEITGKIVGITIRNLEQTIKDYEEWK